MRGGREWGGEGVGRGMRGCREWGGEGVGIGVVGGGERWWV